MSAAGNLKEQYRVLGIHSFDTIPQLLRCEYLAEEVFADAKILEVMPEEVNKAGVDMFMTHYKSGLTVERAAATQKE